MVVIAPSPLAGEGCSVLPPAMMGEGCPRQPLTHSSSWADHCALSRKGRGHKRRDGAVLDRLILRRARERPSRRMRRRAHDGFRPFKSLRPSRRKSAIHAKREPRQAEWRPAMRCLSTDFHCFRLIRTMRAGERAGPACEARTAQADPSTTFARGCRRRGR
jgi:hypothetical protein